MKSKDVFLLIGDEEFLKEEWLSSTRQKIFKGSRASESPDFNLFFGNDINLPDVLSTAKTRPFSESKRFIVIKQVELMSSPSHREKFVSYVKAPSPDTILVLESGIREKDLPSDKFLSEVAKFAQVVSFKKLYDSNLCSWISRRALLRKKKIDIRAVDLLRQLKGNSLEAIDEEIEKLSLYVGEKASITEDDVQQLVGKDVVSSIYDMIDAFSLNDKKRVLEISFDFHRKDFGAGINLFCWNLRLLLKVKECLDKGWPDRKIGDYLKLRKFQLERVVSQAGRLTSLWMRSALSEFTEFDLQNKTSVMYDSFSGWQMLLVRLLALL